MKMYELLDWIPNIIRATALLETLLCSCKTSAQGRGMPLERTFAAGELYRFPVRGPTWINLYECMPIPMNMEIVKLEL